jgi:AraC-like DNA-binding protein
MDIKTIDHIPSSSPIAGNIDNIAIFSDVSKVDGLRLPLRIDFFLSILCEQGRLNINYDNHDHLLTHNSLIVLRPGHVFHSYSTSSDFKGHVIMVSTRFFGESIPGLTQMLPSLVHFHDNPVISLTQADVAQQVEMRNLIQRRAYGTTPNPFRTDIVRSLLEALFFETLSLYSLHLGECTPSAMRRKDALLFGFIQLVEENFITQRSVAYYADRLHVSPKHLSAMIKEASGRTAGDWIDSYVVLEAKKLLRNTGLTIQEISTRLNFANQSFFGKYFKHLAGMSPRQYRSTADGSKQD